MHSDAYVYTFGMTDEALREALRENDTGVLGLADEGRSYVVPVSYHYDGESVWLRLSDDGDSEKVAFTDTTTEASFLVYDVEETHSWSVLMRGALRRDDDAFGTNELRDQFSDLRIFDEDIAEVQLAFFEFVPTEVTARRTD
jgi:nitroimidazol reductase NimA-like FMN-containing flavoprotein (pyridoxamine 5'-phosphate oxidase superfamily)